jgi:hypothetical protein
MERAQYSLIIYITVVDRRVVAVGRRTAGEVVLLHACSYNPIDGLTSVHLPCLPCLAHRSLERSH